MRPPSARARLGAVRGSIARFAAVALLPVLPSALAFAQESERTVRPEEWPQAGRWPVPGWVVVVAGVVLVVLVLAGLWRAIRRRRK